MEDKQETIGLTELLDEINRDLDDFRKKHSSDYSVKNISMWWELEGERVLARHMPYSVVKKLRRIQAMKRLMLWFFAGWITLLIIETAGRLLFR